MRRLLAILAPILAASSAVPVAVADPAHDQGEVRKERRAGNVRSLREIERRVLPKMAGMQYLGPEYDPIAIVYRLKFIDGKRLYFVDVDARSGKIISTSR